MEINETSNTGLEALQSNNKSEEKATEQRDLFISLLVAQLKNQDPLAPQDGTEFVAQLAQFNSLDQLIGIRQSIDQINTHNQTHTDGQ